MSSHLSNIKKHFWPNLLTSLIPFRPARRAWRGILSMGLFEYIRQIKQDKNTNFENELTIAAIMKNEGPYLREWIEYHKLVGVEKFYLYNNGSTDDTVEILAPYVKSGLVELIDFPGEKKQIPAYNDCVARHKMDTQWLALIDLDEFAIALVIDWRIHQVE